MSKYDEIPITVDNINLKFVTDGPKDQKSIGRTNEAFVQKIFARTKGAETVSQLFRSLQEGTMALASLGMYKTVDFELKECKKPLTTDLLIKLKEKGPFYGNAGVGMSSTRREPMMKIEGLLRNVFGNAEILKGAFSYGVNQTGSFDLTFAKPKSFSSGNPLEPPYGTLAAAAHYNGGTLFRDSNFVEKSSGITLKAESDDKRHLLEYLGAWRDVLPHEASGINTNPEERKGPRLHSNSVLKASMPSLKSALRYTYTYDKTNHKLTPTEGAYVRCSTELAGLGGDVAFAKLEGCGRIHVPLNEHVSVGVGCFGGLLATVSGRDSGVPFFGVPSMINDRFFHRGFRDLRIRGLTAFGPTDDGDAIGGDAYFTLGGSLSFTPPVEVMEKNNIRFHIFANTGNLQLLSDGEGDLPSRVKKLISKEEIKSSVGIGLIAPSPVGRIEINVVTPVLAQSEGLTCDIRWAVDSDFS